MVACSCSQSDTTALLPGSGSNQQCGSANGRCAQRGLYMDQAVDSNQIMAPYQTSPSYVNGYPVTPVQQKKFPYGFILVIILIIFGAMYFMRKNSK